jgi:hypothetical protein
MIRLGFSVARSPTAFRAALAQLALSPLSCVGAGDAEDDLIFPDVYRLL